MGPVSYTAHSQSMLLTPSVRVGLPGVQRLAALPTARSYSGTLRPARLQHQSTYTSRRGSAMAPRASETETPNSTYQYDQIKDVKVHAGGAYRA